MGTSLGKLLAEAGVKGGKIDLPPLTVEDLRAISRKQPKETYGNEAMNQLPTEFLPLLEVSNAGDFVTELRKLLEGHYEGNTELTLVFGEPTVVVTEHTIFGLSQLVHYHRDRFSGSRRKGFDHLVPKFLKMKARLEKKPPADLRSFVLQNL